MNIHQHDPLTRQLDGEPHFALMARDVLAPAFVRLYAAVVEGRYDRAPDLLQALLRTAKEKSPRPHKDSSHAWSARQVADAMEQWRTLNMTGDDPQGRVNVVSGIEQGFRSAPTINEIKNARPPTEPEEAT